MFLTNEQAEVRLSSEKNLANRFNSGNNSNPVRAINNRNNTGALVPDEKPEVIITEKVISLPGKNRINLTKEERTNIAIDARSGANSQTNIARANNLQLLTVNNIASGKTKGIDEERVTRVIGEAKDLALSRLMSSLGLLTDDKLSGCSAKDLSTIASNMGRVVEKIQDKVQAPDNINFIIYAPELKQERAYDRVEV